MDIVNMYSVDWVYVKIKKQSLKKVVGYNVSLHRLILEILYHTF